MDGHADLYPSRLLVSQLLCCVVLSIVMFVMFLVVRIIFEIMMYIKFSMSKVNFQCFTATILYNNSGMIMLLKSTLSTISKYG